MRHLLAILAALVLCAPAFGQQMKSLMFNATNGQVVANTGTNALAFTNEVQIDGVYYGQYRIAAPSYGFVLDWDEGKLELNSQTSITYSYGDETLGVLVPTAFNHALAFAGTNAAASAAATRTNLGLGWSALTNSNAATALLGYQTNGQVVYTNTNTLTFMNDVQFGGGDLLVSSQRITGGGVSFSFEDGNFVGTLALDTNASITFEGASAAATRTNLGFVFVLRTNSTSRASTTSLADDEALAYSFPSSGNYFVTLSHLMVVDTNTGLKVRMVGTNATVRGTWSFGAVQATNEHSVSLSGVSGTRMFHQWFVVDASTNASIVFQWAQQTSGTNATQILPGSFLRIERMD